MAQRSGDAGVAVVSAEFLACQQELVSLVEGKKLSTKKSDSRRRKVTSPQGKSHERDRVNGSSDYEEYLQ